MLVKCKTFLQFWSVSSLLILRVRVFNNTFPSVSKNSRLLLSRGWFVLCNWNCTAQFIFTLRFLHWVILGHWPPFLFQFYRLQLSFNSLRSFCCATRPCEWAPNHVRTCEAEQTCVLFPAPFSPGRPCTDLAWVTSSPGSPRHTWRPHVSEFFLKIFWQI